LSHCCYTVIALLSHHCHGWPTNCTTSWSVCVCVCVCLCVCVCV
jgi:hypothetical protein